MLTVYRLSVVRKKGLVRTMKTRVNLVLIFPIKDPSASFMSFKANCLLDAGIITEAQKQWVDARVLSVLAGD